MKLERGSSVDASSLGHDWGALLLEEVDEDPDRLLHLDLLQDVELLVVVRQSARGAVPKIKGDDKRSMQYGLDWERWRF